MDVPDGDEVEIIVVDNNSNDDTPTVAKDFAGTSGLNVRYLFEPKQGVSHAVNLGLAEATGEIVAITADDCIVDKAWVTSILKEFRSDPSLWLVGGRVDLYDEADAPISIRPFAERRSCDTFEDVVGFIAGNNVAFRRDLFSKIGGYDVRMGPGAAIPAAEDLDYLYRIWKAGFKILYAPEILLYHHHGRQDVKVLEALSGGYIVGRGAFYMKHILKGDKYVLKRAYWEIRNSIKTILASLSTGKIRRSEIRLPYLILLGALKLALPLRS